MSPSKKIVTIALLTAIAIILSYVESLIPSLIPIPGAKIGLPNIVTLLSLNMLGMIVTLLIVISRILISGFMFGNLSAIIYALSGGVLSWLLMGILIRINQNKGKPYFSLYFISILGAIAHNVGQLIAASIVVNNAHLFIYYLPFLTLIAIPTGLLIAFISNKLMKNLSFFSSSLFH
ncbi:MAG: Gx transporter family protein [Eubacteriaceae bacterium]|nr:Gx transporter family protein [Eubacteriaceae bacterium]